MNLWPIVCLSLLLVACLPKENLTAQPLKDGRVQFAAEQSKAGSEPKCIASLAIFELIGSGADAQRADTPRWEVVSLDGRCVTNIRYPEVPSGFRLTESGKLERGRAYNAVAHINQGLAEAGFDTLS